MQRDSIVFILIATAIAFFFLQKCAGRTPDGRTVTSPPKVEVNLDEAPVSARNKSEGAISSQHLTPEPLLVKVRLEPVYRPAPELVAVGDGPAGANLDMVGLEVDKSKTATLDMILVQKGCFVMGNSMTDSFDNEVPAHKVCLKNFYLDAREVTQEAFMGVTGSNPSRFEGFGLPVESVSWHEAARYCALEGKRLPTEAEWEYAARSGGIDALWAGTDSSKVLVIFAWMKKNSSGRTHKMGTLKPNAIGLHDMSGNVREWVADWFQEGYYSDSVLNDPEGPTSGTDKVLRGGSWDDLPRYNRVSYRVRLSPEFENSRNGFRCALSPEALN